MKVEETKFESVCTWYYRPGIRCTHWAKPSCKDDYNYLSKVPKMKPAEPGVADMYNGLSCPKCHRKIVMDYTNINNA